MLDNRTFWNKISITIHQCTRYDKMVEVLRIWLSRAKDLPCLINFLFLPLEAVVSKHHPHLQQDINKNIIRDLISPRKFKRLGIIFADYHLHDLLQLSDKKLSSIEVLRLRCIDEDNNCETVSLLDIYKLSNVTSFYLIPTLFSREIPISITECTNFERFSGMAWHQLRHIYLDVKLPALRRLNILETSSSVLETCSLSVFEDHPFVSSRPFRIKPVHCPQLQELKCRIYSNSMLTHGDSFLLCLWLPKLKSLKLLCPKNVEALIDPQTLFKMQSVCSMRPEELTNYDRDCDVDAGALGANAIIAVPVP